MTGSEHYHAAELLLAEAEAQPGEASARSIATAQVHATLAPAAAAAIGAEGPDAGPWHQAAATRLTWRPKPSRSRCLPSGP
jgi:predicted secreted Zn-dependent protease